MIIAHYPGAGGNRYGRFRKQMNFYNSGSHMHYSEFSCLEYRYLTHETKKSKFIGPEETKHTHTLSDELLQEFFPGHEIIKIKADLKKSLCREWQVVMKFVYAGQSTEQQVGQMFDMIAWHHNYYKLYPPNWNKGTVVDVDTDTTNFGKVMRKELNVADTLFDFAWECFIQHGHNAQIIDLYRSYEQR